MVNSRGVESVRPILASLEGRLHAWGFFHFDGTEIKQIQTGAVSVSLSLFLFALFFLLGGNLVYFT